ncbi:MAG: hypothetical protein HQ464_12395 [Planctomycetes bacterium]|nr:hypothetical protein [Planctomycetota bacterium]
MRSTAPRLSAVGLAVMVMSVMAHPESARAEESATSAAASPVAGSISRPTMQQAGPNNTLNGPPSARDVAESRPAFRRRFRDSLAHTDTAVGARTASETLLAAAATEDDRTLKWMMLDEARRLGEAAGQAGLVTRAIMLASAFYDFDAIDMELRSLKLIPLRGLDAKRATNLALAAEQIATRAEADQRLDKAATAELLAYRAWQRAGNTPAARQAAARHDALERP